MNIEEILEQQRAYFHSGATLPVSFRIENLKKLYAAVQKYEREIGEALTEDLGKSDFEGFMCETGLVLSELHYMIRHTRKFARASVLGSENACQRNAAVLFGVIIALVKNCVSPSGTIAYSPAISRSAKSG